MNGDIGLEGCAVPFAYKHLSTNILVSWETSKNDIIDSAIGSLQIFSGKSQTSLSAGAMRFPPLHITVQNFTEAERSQHISDRSTVVAYLPVSSRIASASSNPAEKSS